MEILKVKGNPLPQKSGSFWEEEEEEERGLEGLKP